MVPLFLMGLALAALLAQPASVQADDKGRVYEMRTYFASEGKLDALHARFRNHTLKLFEKHDITSVGYWVPLDNKDNLLIFLLSYPNREAREKSWKAFGADPDWQKAYKESEKDGTLVKKVEQRFMTTTDYSPEVKPAKGEKRVFELRLYTASEGNLGHLNARFRNHTLKLFEKHGMTNLWYFSLTKDQKAADSTLLYFLAHRSADAAKASFDAFRKDPAWVEARKASEEKAGGSLTAKDGVKSLFLEATDYSPIR